MAELFPVDDAADDGTAIELDVHQEEQELDDHLYTPANTGGLQSSQDTAQLLSQTSTVNAPLSQETTSQFSQSLAQMRGPVAKKEQLDEVHRRYFISGHHLHLKQLALLLYKLANSKQDLELKKLQKTKMREDIKNIQLTNKIAQLQKRSLQLDIFSKENEIL